MIIINKCRSWGGSTYLNEGGVRIEKCSKCDKPYVEPRFGPSYYGKEPLFPQDIIFKPPRKDKDGKAKLEEDSS